MLHGITVQDQSDYLDWDESENDWYSEDSLDWQSDSTFNDCQGDNDSNLLLFTDWENKNFGNFIYSESSGIAEISEVPNNKLLALSTEEAKSVSHIEVLTP